MTLQADTGSSERSPCRSDRRHRGWPEVAPVTSAVFPCKRIPRSSLVRSIVRRIPVSAPRAHFAGGVTCGAAAQHRGLGGDPARALTAQMALV